MKTPEERIALLERNNRRWQTACFLGVIAAGGIAAFGALGPDNVPECMQTRRLEIVDEEGEVQVVLNAAGKRGAIAILNNPQKRLMFLIGPAIDQADEKDPDYAMYLFNRQGQEQIRATTRKDGAAGLLIYDVPNKQRLIAGSMGKAGTALSIVDDDDALTPVVMIKSGNGEAGLTVADAREGKRAFVGLNNQNTGVLITDENVQQRVWAGLNGRGTASVGLLGAQGRPVVGIETAKTGGKLAVYNTAGQPAVTAAAEEVAGGIVSTYSGDLTQTAVLSARGNK